VKKSAARIDDAVDGAGAAKHDRKPKEKRFTNTGELSKVRFSNAYFKRVQTLKIPSFQTLVFVANLPFEVDDAGLSNLFTELNLDVKSARIITKPNFRNKEGPPRSKGFGFVEVANEEQQKAAVEKLTGYKFGEREITIKVANTRAPIESVEGAEGVTEQA
jgi:RNA recognition motif-containing protein